MGERTHHRPDMGGITHHWPDMGDRTHHWPGIGDITHHWPGMGDMGERTHHRPGMGDGQSHGQEAEDEEEEHTGHAALPGYCRHHTHTTPPRTITRSREYSPVSILPIL